MTLSPNHEKLSRRTSADTEGEVQRVLRKLEETGQDLTILRLVANSSHVFRPFVLLSSALLHNSVLPARIREMIILWMAAENGVPYEWAEHVPIAIRTGVTAEQIAALESGRLSEELFSPDELLGLKIARDLCSGGGVGSADFDLAVATWGIEGAMDVIFSVGLWGGLVPKVIEGLGLVRPDSV